VTVGASSPPWIMVYLTSTERLEYYAVEGGAIYRNWVLTSSDSVIPLISITFVPGQVGIAPPANITPPVVGGAAQVSGVLSVTTGNWSYQPTVFSYQWQSAGVDVGTDSNTYTVQPTDAGNPITCTVTATNANGSGSATSNQVLVQ
jgi:hypothetical protein